MAHVFLSLGSNLGDRVALLREAVHRLSATSRTRVVHLSPLYETEPWEHAPGDVPDRDHWFLNCVVAVETALRPPELLGHVQEIEHALGRTRDPAQTPEARRFVARPLDIDILLYDDQVISVSDELHIPHLLMHERAFVLRPLADLAPELEHPTLYQTIRGLADDLDDPHTVRLAALPADWLEP
jgi:2-amino-4-hydroxy-6-hydroxymethyldihydropteridine diphosphokinase